MPNHTPHTPQPFWNEGEFHVGISFEFTYQDNEKINRALKTLEEFRYVCQRHYFAYVFTAHGLHAEYDQFDRIFNPANRNRPFEIGSSVPNAPQLPGKSTIGYIREGELLDALKSGGEFENALAKAFMVFVHQLWDDQYRIEIARALSVHKRSVICPLLGDLRRIRNLIIHQHSIVPAGFSSSLEFLPHIWTLMPGSLTISNHMMNSLMEQLNAIQLTVTPP